MSTIPTERVLFDDPKKPFTPKEAFNRFTEDSPAPIHRAWERQREEIRKMSREEKIKRQDELLAHNKREREFRK